MFLRIDKLIRAAATGVRIEIPTLSQVFRTNTERPGTYRAFLTINNYVFFSVNNNIMCYYCERKLRSDSSNGTGDDKINDLTGVANAKLVWIQACKGTVTCLATLGSNVLVIGLSSGNMMLVDWTCTSKPAFGLEHNPKVLSCWFGCKGLKVPTSENLDVAEIVVPENIKLQNVQLNKKNWLESNIQIMWVTTCGWIFSVFLDGMTPSRPADIVMSTSLVQYKRAETDSVFTRECSWSLPLNPICAASTNGSLLVERVPDCIQVLPQHDRRVLCSNPILSAN